MSDNDNYESLISKEADIPEAFEASGDAGDILDEILEVAAETPETPETSETSETSESSLTDNTGQLNQIISEIESISSEIEKNFTPRQNTSAYIAAKEPKYRFFSLSAGASLIFSALILLWSVFVSGDIIAVFRLSPVILIFIGVEIVYAVFKRKEAYLSPSDFILAVILIVFTFTLSLISISLKDSGVTRDLACERFAEEIKFNLSKDAGDFDNLKSVEINISLLDENADIYRSLGDIKPSDTVTVRVYFNKVQKSLADFSKDCRFILDILLNYGLPFGNVEFYSIDAFNRIDVTVNLRFNPNITVRQISLATKYSISDDDFDLVDLED